VDTFVTRIIGLTLPIIVCFVSPTSGSRIFSSTAICAVVIMYYITYRMAFLAKRNKLDIFLVSNYLFFYVSSGIAIVVMELQGIRLKIDWAFPLNNILTSLLCSFLSLLVIEVAYLKSFKRSVTDTAIKVNILSKSDISRIAIISLLLSSLYFALIPINSLFYSRASTMASLNSAFANDSGQALIGLLVAFTKIAPLCLGTFVILARRIRKERYTVLDIITICPSLIAINPISSARYVFIILVITLGCSFLTLKPNRQSEFIVYIGVILAVLVFPNLDFARYEKSRFTLISITESLRLVANKDYDQIPMGALTLQTIRTEIAPIGKQFLGEIGFWVPRSYWLTKPSDTSILIAKDTGLSNSNLSVPLWAEGWASFRHIGILFYPFLLGFSAGKLKRDSQYSSGKKGMYFFLSGSVFILQRGPLLQATGIVSFGLLCFFLLSRFERYKQRDLKI
jgi:hypothetical protein